LCRNGTQARILLLASQGKIAMYVSAPVLAEYEEVLRRARFKLTAHRIDEILYAIRRIAQPVIPRAKLTVSPDESDNRFLECAEAARADHLVTGNTKHFPARYKTTAVVTGRRFLDLLTGE
jgi:putative PIN family toxin of toxin-antitoxin system